MNKGSSRPKHVYSAKGRCASRILFYNLRLSGPADMVGPLGPAVGGAQRTLQTMKRLLGASNTKHHVQCPNIIHTTDEDYTLESA